ncbi:MAG: Phosphoribosylformylglycinamidinesynthase [Candidatus Alkanophagales archaeon MCA70_species_1]|nr:Phosphoribosylformylglycinamidinesynthase [Candidatus Alkanophaga volatiphilum]
MVKVCILCIEGTNCEWETYLCFKRLGAAPEIVHLKQLTGAVREKDRRRLLDYDCLVIPGGFSAGDYVRAGAIFAARILGSLEELKTFVEEERPVLGICNGFQVLVELGLLPGIAGERATLTINDSARFECRPTLLKHENKGKCLFTKKIPHGRILKMPCAHAEGKFFIPEDRRAEVIKTMEENDQIVLRYVDPDGRYAGYPWNPNGSIYNIAGICNPEGTVFGLMPHPERAFYAYTNADWTRERGSDYGDGKLIFESILEHIRHSFGTA